MNNFEYLSKEEIESHTEAFFAKVNNEYAKETTNDGLTIYHLALQGQWFECAYDAAELQTIIKNCILLVEQFKKKIDAGYGLEQLTKDYEDGLKNDLKILATHSVILKISEGNEEIDQLKQAIFSAVRVGGAYQFLLAEPMFESAIYSTYDALCQYKADFKPFKLVNDPELHSEFFLIRAAMMLHSNNIESEEE